MSQQFFGIKIITEYMYIPKLVLISPKPCVTFVRNKYTFFCVAGTVALRSLNLISRGATVLQLLKNLKH